MNPWTIGWVIWFIAVIGGFALLEWPAIRRKVPGPDRDTLSDHVAEFRDKFPGGEWVMRLIMFSGLAFIVVWLWPHFEKHEWDK